MDGTETMDGSGVPENIIEFYVAFLKLNYTADKMIVFLEDFLDQAMHYNQSEQDMVSFLRKHRI